jgi:hypothetical protein
LFILVYLKTYNGSVHDKKICDEQPLHLPEGITLWQDTGFLGHCPDGVKIRMPKKKPKGKELTSEQKQENREISKFRVLVEHPFVEQSVAVLSKIVCVATKPDSMT